MFSRETWSSPWPWVAVGVVGFGALTWGIVALLERIGRDEQQR
jgi:hypothetical protein